MKPPDLRSIVLCITFEMSRIRWISTSIGGGAGPLKRSAFVLSRVVTRFWMAV